MTARLVPCPRCSKPALFSPENRFRPFCSERCKLIDLGNWADGRYTIPVAASPSADGESDSEVESAAEAVAKSSLGEDQRDDQSEDQDAE